MASEAEPEESSTLRLPLFSKPTYMESPPRSGTRTPPLYSSAAVPFRWEEEPGKPRGCYSAVSTPVDFSPKSLELPPRLFLEAHISKHLNSPTTVLDGPYIGKSSRFHSSSFRVIKKECYGSFRGSHSPERSELGALVLRKGGRGGFIGSSLRWGSRVFKSKGEGSGGTSYVFPSLSMDRDTEDSNSNEEEEEEELNSKNVEITRIKRSGSFSTRTRAHFWATIYEGLKQVVPWRNRKVKKEGFLF